MLTHEELVKIAFNNLFTEKNFVEHKNKFFSIASTFNTIPSEKLIYDDIVLKGCLPIEIEKKISLDVILAFLEKNNVNYQIKGMQLLLRWFRTYARAGDAVFIKMIFDKISLCIQKAKNDISIDQLSEIFIELFVLMLNKFQDDVWWQEYTVHLYRTLVFKILDKFPQYKKEHEAIAFVVSLNNILVSTYYDTNLTRFFPHALYDIIDGIFDKIQNIAHSQNENMKDFLVATLEILVHLHASEKAEKLSTPADRKFYLIKTPKSYPCMRKINPPDRLPYHGKGARQLWFKCFSRYSELLIKLYGKTEILLLQETFQSFYNTAYQTDDNEFKKETQRILNLLHKQSS